MKNLVILSVVAAMLVLSGCAAKKPDAEAAEQAAPVKTETVPAEQAAVSGEDTSSSASNGAMADLEGDMKTVYFDFDKFNIRQDMQSNVSASAAVANGPASKYTIKLEGNCDEWGSDEYNFALGLRRANSVKKSIVAEGVDANRVTMVTFGESNPVCTDKTRDCWAKNRRVDFKLLP